MRRTKEEAAQTRLSILAAAQALIREQGYTATSLVQVAAKAGLTRGAVYWHFKDKEDLYRQLLEHLRQQADTQHFAILASEKSPLKKLKKILRHNLDLLLDDENYQAYIELTWFRTAAPSAPKGDVHNQADRVQELFDTLCEVIKEGQANKEIRKKLKAESTALQALALLNGLIRLGHVLPGVGQNKKLVKEAINDFIDQIGK